MDSSIVAMGWAAGADFQLKGCLVYFTCIIFTEIPLFIIANSEDLGQILHSADFDLGYRGTDKEGIWW